MTGSKRAIRTGHADLHPRQIPMTSAATRSAMTIRVPDAMEATRHAVLPHLFIRIHYLFRRMLFTIMNESTRHSCTARRTTT